MLKWSKKKWKIPNLSSSLNFFYLPIEFYVQNNFLSELWRYYSNVADKVNAKLQSTTISLSHLQMWMTTSTWLPLLFCPQFNWTLIIDLFWYSSLGSVSHTILVFLNYWLLLLLLHIFSFSMWLVNAGVPVPSFLFSMPSPYMILSILMLLKLTADNL